MMGSLTTYAAYGVPNFLQTLETRAKTGTGSEGSAGGGPAAQKNTLAMKLAAKRGYIKAPAAVKPRPGRHAPAGAPMEAEAFTAEPLIAPMGFSLSSLLLPAGLAFLILGGAAFLALRKRKGQTSK